MKNKTFTIKTTKSGREYVKTGTLNELISCFGYTLEVGQSYNHKINVAPKNIKSFVSNLQKSYEEKEASCYERTYVELI
jgi:hypothetical protein